MVLRKNDLPYLMSQARKIWSKLKNIEKRSSTRRPLGRKNYGIKLGEARHRPVECSSCGCGMFSNNGQKAAQ